MLRSVSKDSIEDVVEHNTEPFLNQVGLGTSLVDARESGLSLIDLIEGDYVIEDEYGRIWSREFIRRHKGLFVGPQMTGMAWFSNHGFLAVPFRQVPRRCVNTREDLYRSLAALTQTAEHLYPNRVVVYRGQTQEYLISREPRECELLFGSVNVLEPSLRPSGTRRTPLSDRAQAIWSLLVQRHLANSGKYAPAHRSPETGQAWPHATHFGEFITLAFAQHYGLPTPALDVTTDVGVALWFALHTMTGGGGNTSVNQTSGGEGVVYVIAGGRGEYFGEDLPDLIALRPQRQHGGFLASNWGNSKNRVVRYLVGAIYFPHSLADEIISEIPTAEYLFPGPDEDGFVELIQHLAWHKRLASEELAEIANNIYWVVSSASVQETAASVVEKPNITTADDINPEASYNRAKLQPAEVEETDFLLGLRLYSAGEIEEAERQWRRAAENEDLDSAAMLGWLLNKRGDPDGEHFMRRAASKGQPDAMNNLGLIYENSNKLEEAEQWFERAALAGNIAAAYNLGSLLIRTGRRREAESWMCMAAKGGDPDAACSLGKLLYNRGELAAAERWFRIGAELGQAQAAYNLGQLCEYSGRLDEAAQWFRKAAEEGDPDAAYRLARLNNP